MNYNGVEIVETIELEDGMIQATSDTGSTYIIYPEEWLK